MTRRTAATTLLDTITAIRPTLTTTAARVADVVTQDPAAVAGMGIIELAELADTSVGSVNRFCRAVGLEGYTALRLELAAEAGRATATDPDADPSGSIEPDADVESTLELIAASSMNAIRRTAALLDTEALDRLAEAVSSAGHVQIFAFGGSARVAGYLADTLTGIGVLTLASSDVSTATAHAVNLTSRDVAIAVSYSGRAAHALDLLAVARERGALAAAITSSAAAPLAELADLTLATTARTSGSRYRGTAGRHAQLLVTDALYVRVAQRRFDASQRLLDLADLATARYQAPSAGRRRAGARSGGDRRHEGSAASSTRTRSASSRRAARSTRKP